MKAPGQDLFTLLQSFFTIVLSGQIPPKPLILGLLSKGLGLGIVVGASLVKLPQILAVKRSRSADGLSKVSYELEEVGLAVLSANGFILGLPFSAFGEAIFLLLQNTFLLGQIYYYSKTPVGRGLAGGTALAAWFSAVAAGQVDHATMVRLLDMVSLIFLSARLPQIYQNFKNKSTGQLSIITTAANLLGALARIFTTIHEGGNAAMVRGYILGATMSTTLICQILYYGSKTRQPRAKKNVKAKR
eukprot:jgi/Botrbrau1/2817/Bobra.0125s0027.1